VRDAGVAPYDDDLEGYRNLIMDQRRRERSDAKKNKKDKKNQKSNKKTNGSGNNSIQALEAKLTDLSEQKQVLENEMASSKAINKPALMDELLSQYAVMEQTLSETEAAWFEAQGDAN
jgi:ATP-binding cassette subfamily F protein 3